MSNKTHNPQATPKSPTVSMGYIDEVKVPPNAANDKQYFEPEDWQRCVGMLGKHIRWTLSKKGGGSLCMDGRIVDFKFCNMCHFDRPTERLDGVNFLIKPDDGTRARWTGGYILDKEEW